ncbi:MAG: hypothetical protein ACREKM_13545 [Longimicrobiales bacterium]
MKTRSWNTSAVGVAALVLAACVAETGDIPAAGSADTTAARADTAAQPAPQTGDASDYPADVPDDWAGPSLPPASVLVRDGACPFECCQYGEWWSDSATVVYRSARDTDDVAFTLPPRTPITAESGTLFVTSLARVVFDAPMSEEKIGVPGVSTLTPADTLYLIEPIGEGSFIVWLRGKEVELPGIWESYYPGTTARREGEYAREWWVHIRTGDGREGWVWMDRTLAPMWGADACGGPHRLN